MSTDPSKPNEEKKERSNHPGKSSIKCPGVKAGCPGGRNCPAQKRTSGIENSNEEDKNLTVISPNMQPVVFRGVSCPPQHKCPMPIVINAQTDQCNTNADLRIELYIHQLTTAQCSDHCYDHTDTEKSEDINKKSSSKVKSEVGPSEVHTRASVKSDDTPISGTATSNDVVSRSKSPEDVNIQKPVDDEDVRRSRRSSLQSESSKGKKSDNDEGAISSRPGSLTKSAEKERSMEMSVKNTPTSKPPSSSAVVERVDVGVNTDREIDETETIEEGRLISRGVQT